MRVPFYQIVKNLLLMFFWLTPSLLYAEKPASCKETQELFKSLVTNPEVAQALEARIEQEISGFADPHIIPGYCRAVEDNLRAKIQSKREGVSFNEATLVATTILFERFKIETYIRSGVVPKRYFGFLDGEGITGAYERRLVDISTKAAQVINEYARTQNLVSRINAKEVIVTFLAEGGALLLTAEFSTINRVHPVRHVGLDNFRIGFSYYPQLVEILDGTFDTRLNSILIPVWPHRTVLLRPMTFAESVISTAIMYFYEKELAERKRHALGLNSLMSLSFDEQFIHTSLVYNSGILFSDKRVAQIIALDTADYLNSVNQVNRMKRGDLPIELPSDARRRLGEGHPAPQQLTHWSAVYHILQRYGAWVALDKFYAFIAVLP